MQTYFYLYVCVCVFIVQTPTRAEESSQAAEVLESNQEKI